MLIHVIAHHAMSMLMMDDNFKDYSLSFLIFLNRRIILPINGVGNLAGIECLICCKIFLMIFIVRYETC